MRALGVVIFVIVASLVTAAGHSHYHCGGQSSYLERLKAQFREAQAALFPPTLDFRSGWPWRRSGDGAVEKLEEAIGKSLENAKRTMEDSAEAVAQTLHQSKSDHMMKMTSNSHDQDDDHSEL